MRFFQGLRVTAVAGARTACGMVTGILIAV